MSTQQVSYHGVGVSAGRVIGPVLRMPDPITAPADGAPLPEGSTADAEIERLAAATQSVAAALKARAATATGDAQAVLKATALMASDRTLLKSASKLVSGGTCAESAIWEAADAVATQLAALGGYMAERAGDVLDVRARIVAELRGVPAPGIWPRPTPPPWIRPRYWPWSPPTAGRSRTPRSSPARWACPPSSPPPAPPRWTTACWSSPTASAAP